MLLLRWALVAFLLVPAGAEAASQSQIPAKFGIPWGNSAGSAYTRTIPQASQIGITNCAASLTDGFPPLTFTPAAFGGCPPFGQDMNGILNQITQWDRWQSMGGPVFYDSGFSTNIGGYPKGARLMSSILQGRIWYSTADNNTTNPDDQTGASANWVSAPGTFAAGMPVQSLTTVIPLSMVSSNGLTVGNALSNATNRANADTYWLFSFLWTNCSGCQLFNSGGGGISRGANASADWAANDAIATVNMNGATLMGADSQGGTTTTNLSNVPVTSGSRTVPTSILGENLHVLTVGELATHNHGITDPGHSHSTTYFQGGTQPSTPTFLALSAADALQGRPNATINTTTNVTGITINNNGSNTPHNTVPRSIITYWNLAL